VLARYGGEEFVVLLRDATPEESESVAERVRSGIATLSGLPGEVKLTVSIGVAMSRGTELPEEFLLRCDEAMYGAKRGGRNAVVIHRSVETEPIGAL
jgi:diguanylate cyclase (GGDEF)-like protein